MLLLLGLTLLLFSVLVVVALRTRLQVQKLRAALLQLLRVAMADMTLLEEMRLHVKAQVDERLPIETTVRVPGALQVRVQAEVPVRETVQTRITLNLPMFGAIPMEIAVPVDLRVAIDQVMPVTLAEELPVALVVPVRLEAPVEVDLRATEVGAFLEQVVGTLQKLEALIEKGV